MVVVSGDEGERRTGGQESEDEGSLLVDTSGESDMEGVGWAAGGETETEGFSDGGRGMWRGERVVRRAGDRGGGNGGRRMGRGAGGPSKGTKRGRGEYSFDSGETESADEDMGAGGESVGERQRGGGPSGGQGGNRYWSVMLPRAKEGSGEGYLVMLRESNFRMGGMMARSGWGIIEHEDFWKRRDMWRVWLADGLHLGEDGVTHFVLSVGERVNCERGRVKVWQE